MKYIIFDLDDTLLNKQGCVTEFTLQTLKHLQSLGHKLVINTARSQYYSQKYFDIIGPDYAIFNGGALIVDKTGRAIFTQMMDIPTVQQVIARLKEVTAVLSVQAESGFYTSSADYTAQNAIYFDFWKESFAEPAYKIVSCLAHRKDAETIAQDHHLELISYLSGDWVRFTQANTDKASGNRKLIELLGGDMSDVMAFGDDSGDLGMILEAGTGVLMKNAREELRELSPTLSQFTNDEDGVAKFLRSYFHLDEI